jgi:hypothetical protein
MKLTDKYYKKIYKETSKLTKKLFGQDVTNSLVERYKLKKYFENLFNKSINEISGEDVLNQRNFLLSHNKPNDLLFKWSKYKTLCKILEVIETVDMLKTFTIEEYENEC